MRMEAIWPVSGLMLQSAEPHAVQNAFGNPSGGS
jgi:hypothetical protein